MQLYFLRTCLIPLLWDKFPNCLEMLSTAAFSDKPLFAQKLWFGVANATHRFGPNSEKKGLGGDVSFGTYMYIQAISNVKRWISRS